MHKKTLIKFCVILGVLVLALTGVLAFPSLYEHILKNSPISQNKDEQPDELLKRYFSNINNGQYEELYETLTEQSQATISKDELRMDTIAGEIVCNNHATFRLNKEKTLFEDFKI